MIIHFDRDLAWSSGLAGDHNRVLLDGPGGLGVRVHMHVHLLGLGDCKVRIYSGLMLREVVLGFLLTFFSRVRSL